MKSMIQFCLSYLNQSTYWNKAALFLGVCFSTSVLADPQEINIDEINTEEGLIELATKLAPQYRFHPYEYTFPISMEELLEHSEIVWDFDNSVSTNPTLEHLTGEKGKSLNKRSDKDFMRFKPSVFEHRPFEAGRIKNTPIYLTTRESATRLYLVYSMLMPFSDCQIFRARIFKKFEVNHNARRRNFEWCNAARHYGDWENAVVVIDKTYPAKILGLVTSAHGHETFTPYEKLNWYHGDGGHHPRIHVALNSHALYPMAPEGTPQVPFHYTSKASVFKQVVDLYNSNSASQPVWKIDWMQTIDLVTDNGQLVKFREPLYKKNGEPAVILWNSWRESKNNRIELLEDRNLENWEGRWGQTRRVETNMGNPSGDIPHVDDGALKRTADDLRGLVNFYNSGNIYKDVELPRYTSPNSPWDSGWAKKNDFGNDFALAEDKYYADNDARIKTLTIEVEDSSDLILNVKKLKAIGQNNLHKWSVAIHPDSSRYQGKHIRLQLNSKLWNDNTNKSFGGLIEGPKVGLKLDAPKTNTAITKGRLAFRRTNGVNTLVYVRDEADLKGEHDIVYLPIIKRDGTEVTYRLVYIFKS
ncbi:hypothetical protein [Pleionea sp. CnH1-48]|uniref:hypothetical protein n=1 Tax=Pleionea sp. CnH1-48 TaxID=2954494 RepID=UPI0020974A04|nr:hypothetical protein [Pleionea sp. CnH1-48]MCO7225947.1 hypothetical protein [Pleionea sp. CnH1-48]